MNAITITEEEMLLSKDYSAEEPSIKASEAELCILNERIEEAKNSVLKSNEEVMRGARELIEKWKQQKL